jgi:hypothetical protein
MHGAIPPLPNMSPWHGAQLKEAQGQLHLYLLGITSSSINLLLCHGRSESNPHTLESEPSCLRKLLMFFPRQGDGEQISIPPLHSDIIFPKFIKFHPF